MRTKIKQSFEKFNSFKNFKMHFINYFLSHKSCVLHFRKRQKFSNTCISVAKLHMLSSDTIRNFKIQDYTNKYCAIN